jgi:hypothetical protein
VKDRLALEDLDEDLEAALAMVGSRLSSLSLCPSQGERVPVGRVRGGNLFGQWNLPGARQAITDDADAALIRLSGTFSPQK